jgi:hypothetical protein
MKKLTIAGTPYEFWFLILERGTFPGDTEWKRRVEKEWLHEKYSAWVQNIHRKSTQTQLGMALNKVCPHVKECWIPSPGGRPKKGWDFGDLKSCRDAFCRFFSCSHNWDDERGPESDASAPIMDYIEGIRSVDTSSSAAPSPKAKFEEYDNFDIFCEKGDDNLGRPFMEG